MSVILSLRAGSVAIGLIIKAHEARRMRKFPEAKCEEFKVLPQQFWDLVLQSVGVRSPWVLSPEAIDSKE